MTNWKCNDCGFSLNFKRQTSCGLCGERRDGEGNVDSTSDVLAAFVATFLVIGLLVGVGFALGRVL